MLYLDFLLFDYSRIFVGSISNCLLLFVDKCINFNGNDSSNVDINEL
jgi:hypothetical protein